MHIKQTDNAYEDIKKIKIKTFKITFIIYLKDICFSWIINSYREGIVAADDHVDIFILLIDKLQGIAEKKIKR